MRKYTQRIIFLTRGATLAGAAIVFSPISDVNTKLTTTPTEYHLIYNHLSHFVPLLSTRWQNDIKKMHFDEINSNTLTTGWCFLCGMYGRIYETTQLPETSVSHLMSARRLQALLLARRHRGGPQADNTCVPDRGIKFLLHL